MISLLIPSRGRPHNIRRLTKSVRATAHGPVEIVWRVDNDDPDSLAEVDRLGDAVVVGPRVIPTAGWNEAWQGYSSKAGLTGICAGCDA